MALLTPNSASTSLLQALKMLAIASTLENPDFFISQDSAPPLFDVQMTREIFASIDSATRPGSDSLLLTIPAALILMLNTEGSGPHPPNFQLPPHPSHHCSPHGSLPLRNSLVCASGGTSVASLTVVGGRAKCLRAGGRPASRDTLAYPSFLGLGGVT